MNLQRKQIALNMFGSLPSALPTARVGHGSRSAFNVAAMPPDTVEMRLDGLIGEGGVTSKTFIAQLNQSSAAKTINLHLNSPGGSVFDAIAIYNAMLAHPAKVNVYVDGLAASAASVVAMGAKSIYMARGSFMMLHNPVVLTMGDAEDLAASSAMLQKLATSLADIYADRSGKSVQQCLAIMDKETWYTADEAVAEGFADATTTATATTPSAFFESSFYLHVPAAAAHLLRTTPTAAAPQRNPMSTTFTQAQDDRLCALTKKIVYPEKFGKITAAEDAEHSQLSLAKTTMLYATGVYPLRAPAPASAPAPAPTTQNAAPLSAWQAEAQAKKDWDANLDNCQSTARSPQLWMRGRQAQLEGMFKVSTPTTTSFTGVREDWTNRLTESGEGFQVGFLYGNLSAQQRGAAYATIDAWTDAQLERAKGATDGWLRTQAEAVLARRALVAM